MNSTISLLLNKVLSKVGLLENIPSDLNALSSSVFSISTAVGEIDSKCETLTGGVLNVQESVEIVNSGLTPLYDPKTTMYIKGGTKKGELVNVTGAGKLFLCGFVGDDDSDSDTNITIVADGVTFKTKNSGEISSRDMLLQGYYSQIGLDTISLFTRNDIFSTTGYGSYIRTLGEGITNSHLYSVEPMTFKENLKITVNRTSGDTKWVYILYELAE